MPFVAQDENYERLFQIYATKFPTDSPETIRWLIEIDLRNEMAGHKSREEAILQILEKYQTVKQQIEKCENSVERLTLLFANREISEESYKRAIKTLENKMNRLKEISMTSISVEEDKISDAVSEGERKIPEEVAEKPFEPTIHKITATHGMKFERPTGFVGNKPRNWIDNNLPRCPFCKMPSLWKVAMEFKFTGYNRYHFRCPNCLAVISIPVPRVAGGILIFHHLLASKEIKIESVGNNPNLEHLVGAEYSLEILQEWARQVKG